MSVCVHVCSVAKSCLTLWDPMDLAYQASLSIGFSRQEYWGGLAFPPLGDLPDPEIEPMSHVFPAFQGNSLSSQPSGCPIFWAPALNSFGYVLTQRWNCWNHMVILFWIFWWAIILFSTMTALYIPASSSQEFQFLHILASIPYFLLLK